MTRALVLSGGGPVGIAWEAGLLAGLAEGGVDLAAADYILGTSAGSFVGSQLAMGRKAADMAAPILAEADRVSARGRGWKPAGRRRGTAAPRRTSASCSRRWQEAASGDARPDRRCAARSARSRSRPRRSTRRASSRASAASSARPGGDAWPTRGFACTAVDAETGEFVVWNADSKVGLARAVASSCSVPGVYPPITINGRRYIDGGMRSGSNADLATGHELVVVVAFAPRATPSRSARMRAPLEQEMQVLHGRRRPHRADPARRPPASPRSALNLMDGRKRPARPRPASSRAGRWRRR